MERTYYDDDDQERSVGSISSVYSVEGESTVHDDLSESASREAATDIAKTERKFVLWSKLLACLVLLLSAVAGAILAYHYSRGQETSEFETDVSA